MVVLESIHSSHPNHHTHTHGSMASTGGGGDRGGGINEYNIPLYPGNLSPTMLDSKKSPLAMLVATCSQIGSDPCHPASTTTSKFSKKLQPPSPNEPNNNHHSHHQHAKQNHRSSRSPPNNSKSSSNSPTLSMTNLTTNTTPTPTRTPNHTTNKSPSPTFSLSKSKISTEPPPHLHLPSSERELNNGSHKKSHKRPRSSSSHNSTASTISPIPPPKSSRSSSQTPPTASTSTTTPSSAPPTTSSSSVPVPVAERDNSNCIPSPTPQIRSGMEVLHGGHRGYPMSGMPTMGMGGPHGGGGHMAAAAAAGYYYPGMMDPSTAMFLLQNPAFRDLRLPFPMSGPGSPSYAAAAAAAAASSSPYLSPYYRPQPGSGKPGECKDPYCTGCPPPSSSTPQLICPAGCASCDHQKVPYPQFYHPSSQPPQQPQPPPQSQSHSPTNSRESQQPHICNWIVGDNYCGKRFTSSEELLTHLRSHTSAAQATAQAEQNSASALALQQHLAATSLYSGVGVGGHHPAFLQQMGGGGGGSQGQLAAMAMQQMQAQMRGFSQFGLSPYSQGGGPGGQGSKGFSLPPGYYPPNPYAGLFPSRPV